MGWVEFVFLADCNGSLHCVNGVVGRNLSVLVLTRRCVSVLSGVIRGLVTLHFRCSRSGVLAGQEGYAVWLRNRLFYVLGREL